MKINIYYGGRGLLEDPTLYVLSRIESVLDELNVQVNRINIYEQKSAISTLPETLNGIDGVVLATTLEWLGIGGFMQQFLDACWLYGDKNKISTLYMMPVVMATTYGERDAQLSLIKSWEMLGGIPSDGICGYVADNMAFELNKRYTSIIEKRTENLYRTISQKLDMLPTSTNAVKQSILKSSTIELTPQETEQLSRYASNDIYVKKQKEDIEELSQFFKKMLGDKGGEEYEEFVSEFEKAFTGVPNFKATYSFMITDINKNLIIQVDSDNLSCYYGKLENPDVTAKLSKEVLNRIIYSRTTFQGAFMSGDIIPKGTHRNLIMLDQVFRFQK